MAEMKKIATRDSYGAALAAIGAEHEDLIVFDADLAGATKTSVFRKTFPDRHFDCGIAEGNMMAVAAGAAAMGLVPFASTFAMFAAGRAFEQIRNSIGYPHLNVKIGATHGGISVGEAPSSPTEMPPWISPSQCQNRGHPWRHLGRGGRSFPPML